MTASSKGKLPAGVELDGDVLRVDLKARPELRELDGVLEVKPLRLLLVRGKRQVRAMCSICPHKPKKQYRVHQLKRARRPEFRCPAHEWTFDRKGRPTGKARKRLPRYKTRLDEEREELRVKLRK